MYKLTTQSEIYKKCVKKKIRFLLYPLSVYYNSGIMYWMNRKKYHLLALFIISTVLFSCAKPKIKAVPQEKPSSWDAIEFNINRGIYGGKIPKSYHKKILSKDGIKQHLGKHLPYVPRLKKGRVPKGYLPIMFGDVHKGYAAHPNAPRSEKDKDGHWYTWIKIRKSTPASATEVTTWFDNWPEVSDSSKGKYMPYKENDITIDGGKNTVYLVQLPEDVVSGDMVRVWGYCINHGEYIDFLEVP